MRNLRPLYAAPPPSTNAIAVVERACRQHWNDYRDDGGVKPNADSIADAIIAALMEEGL